MNMKTISAGEANRHFSSALREVINGETVIVTSCGKPVVTISSMR
jgi:prevent-host-death family protein